MRKRVLVCPSVPAGEAEGVVAQVRVARVGERAGALLDARALLLRASTGAAVRAAQHLRRALSCVLRATDPRDQCRVTRVVVCQQALQHQHMQSMLIVFSKFHMESASWQQECKFYSWGSYKYLRVQPKYSFFNL